MLELFIFCSNMEKNNIKLARNNILKIVLFVGASPNQKK